MASRYCKTCSVNWAPAHTRAGACILCGGGTMLRQDPVDPDAETEYREALEREARRDRSARLHAEFEEYYAKRTGDWPADTAIDGRW